jgi:hypothetical protein
MDTVRAAQQAGLGAMEGALLVGPIAYPVLQREITPMVEDFSEVLAEERRSGEWMLRSLERGLVELPLLPPPLEQEADTPHQPEPVAEVPPEPELELQAQPQPTVPAVAQAAPAPAPGIWKRFTRWLGRLFGR